VGGRAGREAARRAKHEVIAIARTTSKPRADAATTKELLALVEKTLDDGKAEDVVVIDLQGKSSFADYLVIATGRSQRQVVAMAEHLLEALKDNGFGRASAEGLPFGDWVLIDAGDVVVHLFRPEVRTFYNLEKMWGTALPEPASEPATARA
jgi:ribosome-associated protein